MIRRGLRNEVLRRLGCRWATPIPAQPRTESAAPLNVILSVAAGRKWRLLRSLAATEGPVAAAAPILRRPQDDPLTQWGVSAAWVRAPTQDPSAAAQRSC